MKKIFIIAGEPSGDLQASLLVKEMKSLDRGIKFQGLGGELMKREGVEIHYDLTQEAVIGFVEVAKKFNFFRRLFRETLAKMEKERPSGVILVDYPGFNLRMAKEAKKIGLKTIYYISPQIWAWGLSRVEIIKKYVDEMLVFFKFEEVFYQKHGIKVKFVGHPLLDLVHPNISQEEFVNKYKLNPNSKKIYIMPGSREEVARRHLSIILQAIEILPRNEEIEFLLLQSPYLKVDSPLESHFPIRRISQDNYNAIYHSYAGIVASGTATLESAMLGKPFVIIYRTSLLNYLILRPQVKVPYIGMANLILGERALPELIQSNCNPQNLAQEINKLILDAKYYSQLQNKLLKLKGLLGERGAAKRAAEYILDVLD